MCKFILCKLPHKCKGYKKSYNLKNMFVSLLIKHENPKNGLYTEVAADRNYKDIKSFKTSTNLN